MDIQQNSTIQRLTQKILFQHDRKFAIRPHNPYTFK